MGFPTVGPAVPTSRPSDVGQGNPAAAAVTPPSPRVNASLQAATPEPVVTQASLSAEIELLEAQLADLKPLKKRFDRLCDAHNEALKPLAQLRDQLLQPIMNRDCREVDTAHETFESDLPDALEFAIKLGLRPDRSEEFTAMRRGFDDSRQKVWDFEGEHCDALNRYSAIEAQLAIAQKAFAKLRATTVGVVTFHQAT